MTAATTSTPPTPAREPSPPGGESPLKAANAPKTTTASLFSRLAIIALACGTFIGSLTGGRDVKRMLEGPNSGHFTQAALRAVTMMICITNPAMLTASLPLMAALMLESGSMYPKHDMGDMAALGKKLAQKALEMLEQDKDKAKLARKRDGRSSSFEQERGELIVALKSQFVEVNKARQAARGQPVSAATYFANKDIMAEIFRLLLAPITGFFTPEKAGKFSEELAKLGRQPGVQSAYSALLTGTAGELYSGVAGSAAARKLTKFLSVHIRAIVSKVAGKIAPEEKDLIVAALLSAAPRYLVSAFQNAGSTYQEAAAAAQKAAEAVEARKAAA